MPRSTARRPAARTASAGSPNSPICRVCTAVPLILGVAELAHWPEIYPLEQVQRRFDQYRRHGSQRPRQQYAVPLRLDGVLNRGVRQRPIQPPAVSGTAPASTCAATPLWCDRTGAQAVAPTSSRSASTLSAVISRPVTARSGRVFEASLGAPDRWLGDIIEGFNAWRTKNCHCRLLMSIAHASCRLACSRSANARSSWSTMGRPHTAHSGATRGGFAAKPRRKSSSIVVPPRPADGSLRGRNGPSRARLLRLPVPLPF